MNPKASTIMLFIKCSGVSGRKPFCWAWEGRPSSAPGILTPARPWTAQYRVFRETKTSQND